MPSDNDIFMIGWEYPPHNSGGLGVACQGLTQALAGSDTRIHFTLPFQMNTGVSHMSVSSCVHPSWELSATDGTYPHDAPPFDAYASDLVSESSNLLPKAPLDAVELAALPQSALEHKVDQYADLVAHEAHKNKNSIGVVHAHDWMSFPAAAKVQQKTGRPFVAHVHSTEIDRIPSGTGSAFIKNTEYQGMMMANRVIAVSYYTKKLLVDHYRIPEQKIDVVHNGMLPSSSRPDPGTHHFAHRCPVVAFMGRLTSQKGPYHFIWLAQEILKRIPDALFVVAGNGDLYHQLLLHTAKEGLSTSVLFSGFVRNTQKEQLLDRADVFVMPSLSEPFGLVALEAAERHTPVIVSKNAGVNEVLPSAIALDFWDIDQMTDTIQKLLKDEGFTNQVKQGQLEELKDVTWDRAADRVKEVYRRAFLG